MMSKEKIVSFQWIQKKFLRENSVSIYNLQKRKIKKDKVLESYKENIP